MNFWMKRSEVPSLIALIPATFTMEPVQSVSVPSFESSSSHTIVGGNARLHWCVVTKDESDQPS